MATIWTAHAVEALDELLGYGLTASAIAASLSQQLSVPVTRNAVIGKVHRRHGVGALKRPAPVRKEPRAKPEPLPRPRLRLVISNPAPAPEAASSPPGRLSLMELNPFTCRFPIGDPASDDFGFCGAPVEASGAPYCPACHKIAYRLTKRMEAERSAR